MLDKIRKHPVGAAAVISVASAAATGTACAFLIFNPQSNQISYLEGRVENYQEQVTSLQATIASFNQSKEADIKARTDALKGIWEAKESLIREQASQSSLNACQARERENTKALSAQCQGYADFASYVAGVKKQEVMLDSEISNFYDQLFGLRSSAEQLAMQCQRSNVYVGSCTEYRVKVGEIEALQAKILAKQKYLSSISDQVLALSGKHAIE